MLSYIADHPYSLLLTIGMLLSLVGLKNTFTVIFSVDRQRAIPWVVLSVLILMFVVLCGYLLKVVYRTENIHYSFITMVFLFCGFFVYLTTRISLVTIKALQRMAELQREAENDFLTGIYNRRYFIKEFKKLLNQTKRNGPRSVLLMIDLDNFKKINDTYGHAEGDKVLQKFADILNENSRKSDIVARFGGDEFTVLLYNANAGDAMHKMSLFREALLEFIADNYPDCKFEINCSVGIAEIDETVPDIDTALKEADDRCYREKEAHVAREASR